MSDRRAQSKNPQDDESDFAEENMSGGSDPSETRDTPGSEDEGRKRQNRL